MNIKKLKNFIVDKFEKEIPGNLTYHGLHHTMDVLRVCNQYIKRRKLKGKDAYLLRTAALIHDLGFIKSYSDHEDKGMEYAREILPDWGYSKNDIETIASMIGATKIPQAPKTILEKILCDADLDYLGTDAFYDIGQTLYQEFKAYNIVKSEKDWDELQIRFLQKHQFHTDFAKKYREPVKQKFLNEIINKWN